MTTWRVLHLLPARSLRSLDTTDRLLPTSVAGGLAFSTVAAGESHTCGIVTSGIAYCWGNNPAGQLGDGSNVNRLTPTAVAGGLTFIPDPSGSAPALMSTRGQR
jgi:alpha-tubulin suppressor-like RCC1 family protein